MTMGFNSEGKTDLLAFDAFAKQADLTSDEVMGYIYTGKLFPVAPTRQSVLIRRIPSLLTEHLSKSISDKGTYVRLLNKPRVYKGYDEYIKKWKKFIRSYSADAKKENIDLSENCLPWRSDVRFTLGEYVYIEPVVVEEARNFGTANIKRFVYPHMLRGFYSSECPENVLDWEDLYKLNNEPDYSEPISIISRFSSDFLTKYGRNPALCYPDKVNSFEFYGQVDRPLPIGISALAEFLEPESCYCEYGNVPFDNKWFSLLDEADSKIRLVVERAVSVSGEHNFFNLLMLSSYLDQWVPFYPGRNELTCTFDSLRLFSSQIEYAKLLKNKSSSTESFFDKKRLDYIYYNYCVQRSFIYQFMQYVKKHQHENISSKSLKEEVEICIRNTQDQLRNDGKFEIISKRCSGVISTDNFYNRLINIDKDPFYGLFINAAKKTRSKRATQKNKLSTDQSDQNSGLSKVVSSSDLSTLLVINKSKSKGSS